MSRPERLCIIAGTGTEVGKTWLACRLIERARALGWRVAARKPAQSFAPGVTTDAELLAVSTGEPPEAVCPPHRWYPVPMAPPMAADALGGDLMRLDALLEELNWPVGVDLGCLETAGGLCSPIAHDADNLDLVKRIAPDALVLVADAGLGTINAVRASLMALKRQDVWVFLNRFDPSNELHVRNRAWLEDVYGYQVTVDVAEVVRRLQDCPGRG